MKHGDFVKVDFIGSLAGTGKVFDFTQADVAKQEGIFSDKEKYEPTLVILGAGMILPGVEKQLLEMKVGEKKDFSVPVEEGFGPRNPKLVKTFSLQPFLKQKVSPSPGSFVDIDGLRGKVQSVSGGRVRVDFNNPLAGKELQYQVTVVSVISDPAEKISSLFSRLGLPCKAFVEGEKLVVESEKPLPTDIKNVIEESVAKWVKEVTSISFAEKK